MSDTIQATSTATQPDPLPRRALAIMPHPDDAEYYCGGALAWWAKQGVEVFIAVVTDGGKGSRDPAMTTAQLIEIRQQEQQAAALHLGAKEVVFLGFPDGELLPTLAVRRELIRLVRRVRPDTVVCPDPDVRFYGQSLNHPDHRATGEATLAVLKAATGNHLYYPELQAEGLEPHRVQWLYLAGPVNPNFEVDITSTLALKTTAQREHRSQYTNPEQFIEQESHLIEPQSLADGSLRWVEKFQRFRLE
ncbi:MAG: PIG-L family deacetylase [Chloroflexi bacterium]|nr:PIG-L family deacetylase [Chloroflexota bacterium]